MLLNKTVIEKIGKCMNILSNSYSLLSYLDFEEDNLRLVVEFVYRRRSEIDDIFHNVIFTVFSKFISSYCYEWTGEDDFDICKLVVNLKF